MIFIFAAFYTWTVFALVLFVVLATVDNKAGWKELALSLVWPILIPMALVYFPYVGCVKSAQRMRQDLKNRGLLKEFDKWVDENKSEKDL